jgi:hypothetical protein
MSCGSIRKHIEEADEALRKAIIIALEQKQDEQLETLFAALGKVRELILTTPIRFTDNVDDYYRNNAEYNFNLDATHGGDMDAMDNFLTFPVSPTGTASSDTISFNTVAGGPVNVPGGMGQDVITFGTAEQDDKDPA